MINKCICETCGLPFDNIKVKANHIRWKHMDNQKCKENMKKMALKFNDKKFGKIIEFKVKCAECNNLFVIKEREKKFPSKEKYFCNKICAAKYSRSFLTREKQIDGMKKYFFRNPPKGNTIYELLCEICENSFKNKNKNVKTCSHECYKKLCRKNSTENPNCGGETNYKKYRYKDIWMDSSWEKKLAEWLDTENIVWERSRKHVLFWTDQNNKKRRYYPDFYLPSHGLYVDTKNPYLMKCDKDKISRVLKENNIKLICGDLEYVKTALTKN